MPHGVGFAFEVKDSWMVFVKKFKPNASVNVSKMHQLLCQHNLLYKVEAHFKTMHEFLLKPILL